MNTRLYKTIMFAATALFILLPAVALAQTENGSGVLGSLIGGSFNLVGAVLSPLGYAVMKLASYITMLGGMALNAAVYFTITQMAANLNNPSFTAVDEAWKVIRDLANMGFIFVLLWASLKLIVGNDEGKTQRLIVNMIIAAILINFSLFFTKIVIDVANLLALTFYSALAPIPDGSDFTTSGISNSIMDALKITTLFKSDSLLLSSNLFVVTVLSSIVLLITAFMFFAVTIMLVIRYVVLIFVLILSPIAFVSKVLPGLDDIAKQWKDTLIGQAFFAPIFFLLLWISIKVGRNVSDVVFKDASGFGNAFSSAQGVSTLINFAVIIAFLIISLVTAKKYADMAPSAVGKATNWATGAAGSFAFGTVLGGVGRKTLGRLGAAQAKDAELIRRSNEQKGFAGASARLGLYAARKLAGGSFDARSASLPGSAIGDAVRGTVGKTRFGRAIGADDARLEFLDANVGPMAAEQTGVGKGETKGYAELDTEKKQRLSDEAKASTEAARKAQGELDIMAGIGAAATPAAVRTPQQQAAVDAMEKAIANSSDKEIETIVESNRKLLENQEFANSISVKQLEAINKSDKFSESEKDALKKRRFSEINKALAPGGAGAAAVRGKIRGLSDPELEMIDPSLLSNHQFVSQMRTAQIEAVQKSNKFTTSQKASLRTTRKTPLLAAIAAGSTAPADIAAAQAAMKELGPKEVAALEMTPTQLLSPTMLRAYTQPMLKRMGPELNPADILTLGTAVAAAGGPAAGWVTSPDGRNNGFST